MYSRDEMRVWRAQARDLPDAVLLAELHRRNPPRLWVFALDVAVLLDWEWLYLKAWRRTAGDG